MKAETLKTNLFLTSVQNMKLFCCLWNFVYKQLEGEEAQKLIVGGSVEEYGGVTHGWQHKAIVGMLASAWTIIFW